MRLGRERLFALMCQWLGVQAGVILSCAGVAALVAAPDFVHAQSQTASANLPSASSIAAQDFFRLPDVFRPELSPDGNYLAFLARGGNRLGLAVIDLEKRTSKAVAT